MADVSLDEVIRQRRINVKAAAKRYFLSVGRLVHVCLLRISKLVVTFLRDGKSFDARQKIGVNDVRQRLGGVKDAREKLGQKDARFKIRGRGGAGVVQDARQMINSRKQGQSHQTLVPQFGSNAQGPSLKASAVPQLTVAPPLKITKTIQVRINKSGLYPTLNEHDDAPNKQLKITTANNLLQSRVRCFSVTRLHVGLYTETSACLLCVPT
uniref:DNA polymerase delta interacting protein 3 n=1 Tax=Maylandia zebra TaxID=106582 RepID=A0A3P9BA49_9CICH